MRGAVALSALVLGLPGTHAAATYTNGQLALTLRYEMVCGQPGPGPLTIQLPSTFVLTGAHAVGRQSSVSGHTISVVVPGPKGVTCMSMTMGTLKVQVAGVHASPGSYLVKAEIRRHAFTAHLRIS
jgi:hypothetical protein